MGEGQKQVGSVQGGTKMGQVLQRYVSNELTHFVGGNERTDDERYRLLVEILKSGLLRSSKYSPTRPAGYSRLDTDVTKALSSNEVYHGTYVCFCDIPVADLEIHIRKYSGFGLSFSKDFLARQGASPIFYIAQNSRSTPLNPQTRAEEFDEAFADFNVLYGAAQVPAATGDRFFHFLEWEVFSRLKFFEHTRGDADQKNYYMEREWRVVGKVCFTLDDVSRIIIPRQYARQLRQHVPDYFGQITFAPTMEQLWCAPS